PCCTSRSSCRSPAPSALGDALEDSGRPAAADRPGSSGRGGGREGLSDTEEGGAHGVTKRTRIAGPFSLQYLHQFITRRAAGAFILSRKGRVADFVGSIGTDLAAAIREAGRKTDYRYLWFSYADRAEEAYELERAWHHRFWPADNERSPSRPRDHEW